MKSSLRLLLLCGLAVSTTWIASAADKSYTIAVIPKGTTHEFWQAVHAGAVKAQQELAEKGIKVEVIWKGPLREDDRDQQIQVVENFMTRRVDGIVLAPLDSQALVAPVVNAAKRKIPVVVFDSDLKSDKQISFVATDNFKGGVMAADYLAKLLGEKGNVILLRLAVRYARHRGARSRLPGHPEIEISRHQSNFLRSIRRGNAGDGVSSFAEFVEPLWARSEWHFLPERNHGDRDDESVTRHWQSRRQGENDWF